MAVTLPTAVLPSPFRALGVSAVLGYFSQQAQHFLGVHSAFPNPVTTSPDRSSAGCFDSAHSQSTTGCQNFLSDDYLNHLSLVLLADHLFEESTPKSVDRL